MANVLLGLLACNSSRSRRPATRKFRHARPETKLLLRKSEPHGDGKFMHIIVSIRANPFLRVVQRKDCSLRERYNTKATECELRKTMSLILADVGAVLLVRDDVENDVTEADFETPLPDDLAPDVVVGDETIFLGAKGRRPEDFSLNGGFTAWALLECILELEMMGAGEVVKYYGAADPPERPLKPLRARLLGLRHAGRDAETGAPGLSRRVGMREPRLLIRTLVR